MQDDVEKMLPLDFGIFFRKLSYFCLLVLNFWLLIFLNVQTFGDGIDFCFDASKEGHFLDRPVIKYGFADNGVDCIMQCLLQNESCRSVNYRRGSVNDSYENCELLNAVDSEESECLRKNKRYDYYKLLQPKRTAVKSITKRSCKELLDKDPTLESGVYYLQANDSLNEYRAYCHMTEISGCGSGGWTLVLKTSGSKKTFGYHSPLWTDKKSYAVEDGLEGLTEKETKLASYWNTPFKKICLGMAVNGERKWIRIDYEASSLFSLIADGLYRPTTAGRNVWKSLVARSSLQPNCNEEGFNIYQYTNDVWLKMRVGYMANNQNYCSKSDSCIGFGIDYKGCYIRSNITCGNIAQCSGNDNGPKLTPAFGYILIQ